MSEITVPAMEPIDEDQLITRLKAARTRAKEHEQALMRSQANIDNIKAQIDKTMSELKEQHGIDSVESLSAKITELGASLTTNLLTLETELAKF